MSDYFGKFSCLIVIIFHHLHLNATTPNVSESLFLRQFVVNFADHKARGTPEQEISALPLTQSSKRK